MGYFIAGLGTSHIVNLGTDQAGVTILSKLLTICVGIAIGIGVGIVIGRLIKWGYNLDRSINLLSSEGALYESPGLSEAQPWGRQEKNESSEGAQ